MLTKYKTEDLKDSTNSLFRVTGMLVGLMLSLAFAEVVVQLRAIENAIEREAVAVSDIFFDLERFCGPEARSAQSLLIDYAQAVVDDDWPALADDKLSRRADALNKQLQRAVLELEPVDKYQSISGRGPWATSTPPPTTG